MRRLLIDSMDRPPLKLSRQRWISNSTSIQAPPDSWSEDLKSPSSGLPRRWDPSSCRRPEIFRTPRQRFSASDISGAFCRKSASGLNPPKDLGTANWPESVANLARRRIKTWLPMMVPAARRTNRSASDDGRLQACLACWRWRLSKNVSILDRVSKQKLCFAFALQAVVYYHSE